MAASSPGLLRRLFFGFWHWVDVARRLVLNLVFLVIVLMFVAVLFAGSHLRLSDNTALYLPLKGDLVEQYSGSPRQAEFAAAVGGAERETQVRDVVAVLDSAARDPKITRALLILDDMGKSGTVKLNEVAAALDRFRGAGKQVVAWGSQMDQHQYYLAAHADEVYLHPFGAVLLTGFGGYRNYYRDALDRLGVSVNVFRVGKYKSFVEAFIANGPSKEASEADAYWLDDAWEGYTKRIEKLRKLPEGSLRALLDEMPERLSAAGGDFARLALSAKLVDGLITRDELRAMMVKRGAFDADHKTFRQVSFQEYRQALPDSGDRQSQVAVIVAQGEITDGESPQGSIGARSTSELIRKARDDDTVKAVVLRVDSPGGSAFGAELIRRELEVTRNAGKPVVVSMSDVAASGGYWISTSADKVLADPATITGSIGVFGIVPTFEKTLDKVGVHTGGTTTAWLAGASDLRRPLDPRLGELVQSSVSNIYRQFLDRAAASRHMSPEQVNEVAQGRVWTGNQARERGLVDAFGGLKAAIADAAQRAKLPAGYHVQYFDLEPKGWNRLLDLFSDSAVRSMARAFGPAAGAWLPGGQLQQAADDLGHLWPRNGAPVAALVHCLCAAP